MGERLIKTVNAKTIAALLKQIGWPVSTAGDKAAPQIVSAVNGVNFNICFGTKAASHGDWTDFTISAPFSIDQQISPVVSAFWNRRNRFARVYRTDTHIFLDMDVVVHGGVSETHLKHQLAVWSDLARLFLRYLRADQAALTRYNATQDDSVDKPAKTARAKGRPAAPNSPLRPSQRTAQPTAPASPQHKKLKPKQDVGPA